MPLSPLEYLCHILDETGYLISDSRGLNKDRFMSDETLKGNLKKRPRTA